MIWKDGGRFLGIWRVWEDLEGFGGILKGGMISGDFYRYVTPLASIGMVFIFRKAEMHCHVGKAHSKPCQTWQRALTRCLSFFRP